LAPPPPEPEERALAYLVAEVPRWTPAHKCHSCHHNGDAARALYTAIGRGVITAPPSLSETTRWLEAPTGWDCNGGEGPFNDQKLARLQFASALAEADAVAQLRNRRSLAEAARMVVALQDSDGSWKPTPKGTIGSPVTRGTAIATALARRTLRQAGAERHAEALKKADRWARTTTPESVLDASGVLLCLEKATDTEASAQRRRCQELIRRGESKEGGWGPYVNSGPEVFDTAVVVLALVGGPSSDEGRALIRRGRQWLLKAQESDGSWQETTRPSGADSLAQKLSTTAWATMALLATRPEKRP
jgi:Squalene-hopene cyclase C-terminal domain